MSPYTNKKCTSIYIYAMQCFSQCESCAPLYNDKPFRSGDQLQPMNCRPCQCHGHALSCHYDVLADDHPDEHYRGGGGVCDNCMHNTTGTDLARQIVCYMANAEA